jgi:regulator of RNase E activity RraA
MRFIAYREDLASPDALSLPRSTRNAVEAMAPGCIAVIDAQGRTDAGVLGDILAARMAKRGVLGLVTDGAIRDQAGVRAKLPVWAAGSAAPPSIAALSFAGWQEPISCGGTAVLPGDIMVADDDGVVVIPNVFVSRVIEAGPAQEAFEAWVQDEVERGVPLPGLYPPGPEARVRYEQSRASRQPRRR